MRNNISIKDVAEAAGVSIATVSRVANGKSVRESTKKRVLDVMQEMGYVPNILARGLASSTTNTVGVLVSDISDVFFAKQLSIVEEELRQQGYNIIVVCIDGNEPDEKQITQIQFLLGVHVAGIIFIGPKFLGSTIYNYLTDNNTSNPIPLILLNDLANAPNTYCIVADDTSAIAHVVQELYQKGKKNFIYLYDRINPSGMAKLKGFEQGLSECNLEYREDRTFSCNRNIDKVKDLIVQLLESDLEIDAIVTAQDELAIGALKACILKGYKIPEDISIVGYNNSILAKGSNPELSSVDNNIEILSEISIKTFIDVVQGKRVPNQVIISCDFIERETS